MNRLFLICLVLSSCTGKPSIPDNVMSPDKMEVVLYDVIRADELVTFLELSDSTYRQFSKRAAVYDTVFSVHQVTKQLFQKSLTYYQQRPDLLNEITLQLQTKLTDTSKRKYMIPEAL